MLKSLLATAIVCFAIPALAAERQFDFSQFAQGQCPTGFVSRLTGEGKPGEWKVMEIDVPSLLPSLSPNAQKISTRAVLAQTAQDPVDEHFPILLFTDEEFGDFTLTTRFKIVSGSVDQMAGIAFRAQDEKNYYVLRASAMGNTVRFYKFVNGQRTPPIGNDIPVPTNVWHELKVQCKATEIICCLDGKQCMPVLHDSSFAVGKIGFWTKSDSVCYFCDAHIEYTPRIPLAQTLVTDMIKKYPRVLDLQVYASTNASLPHVIASSKAQEVGMTGGKPEADAIERGTVYHSKSRVSHEVILPLRDRNGDVAGAVKVTLTTFPGETAQTAIARAMPIKIGMEEKLQLAKDLTE